VSDREPTDLQHRALRGSVWGSINAVSNVPIAIAATVVIARCLGPEGFGEYALLSFLIPLVVGATDLGLINAFGYRAAHAYGQHQDEDLRDVASELFTWTLLRWPFIYAGIAFFALRDPTADILYLLVPIAAVVTAGAGIALQAELRLVELSRLALAGGAASAIGSTIAAIAGGNARLVFAAGVSFQAFVTMFQLVWVRGDHGLMRACFTPHRLRHLRADVRFGFVTYVSANLTTAMASRSELLFFKSNSLVARGAYGAAYTVGARMVLPIDAMFGALGSGLTTVIADQDVYRAGIRRVLRMSGALFSLMAPMLIWISAVASDVMFPPSFGNVAAAAVILTASSIVMSAIYPIASIYWSRRLIRPAFVGSAVGVAVNLGLSFALVPRFGLPGAVAANVTGCCFYALVFCRPLLGDELGSVLATYRWRVGLPLIFAVAWGFPLAAAGNAWGFLGAGLICAICQTYATARWWPSLHQGDAAAIQRSVPARVRPLVARVLHVATVRDTV
jgi:O-antigen/teichoic acid export membrane protein